MKVKIFTKNDGQDLENIMNEWFDKNPKIKVFKTTQSSVVRNGFITTIISIYYKMKSTKPDMGPG